METRSKIQLALEIGKDLKAGSDFDEGFFKGFDKAKEMIIQFLTQKSLGYDNAYFFKMEDLKSLGESHIYTDEPLKESERIAKWDWSKDGDHKTS